MEHIFVNLKHLCSYIITIQDNPFINAPIFISIEDHKFTLQLLIKGTVLGVSNQNLTNQNIQNLPNIIISPEKNIYPHNIHALKSPLAVNEDISRIVGFIKTQRYYFNFGGNYENDTGDLYLFCIGIPSHRLISRIKVWLIPI